MVLLISNIVIRRIMPDSKSMLTAVQYAGAHQGQASWIFCGGHTNHQSLLVEAESLLRLVRQRAESLVGIDTAILEVKSRTTAENLFYAEQIFRGYGYADKGEEVVIICDLPCQKKVKWLASKLMPAYLVDVVDLRRQDPNPEYSVHCQIFRLIELKILWKRINARLQTISYFD